MSLDQSTTGPFYVPGRTEPNLQLINLNSITSAVSITSEEVKEYHDHTKVISTILFIN